MIIPDVDPCCRPNRIFGVGENGAYGYVNQLVKFAKSFLAAASDLR
jgi:hypothetical protein